jgi:hypothetical protein
MNYLKEILHRYSPIFAALASLREIFRISVAALPRWVLRALVVNRKTLVEHRGGGCAADQRYDNLQ